MNESDFIKSDQIDLPGPFNIPIYQTADGKSMPLIRYGDIPDE